MGKATYSLPIKNWKFGFSDGVQGSIYDSLSSLLDVSRRSLISSLRVAVPSPNPQGETEATERLRKPDTFRVQ